MKKTEPTTLQEAHEQGWYIADVWMNGHGEYEEMTRYSILSLPRIMGKIKAMGKRGRLKDNYQRRTQISFTDDGADVHYGVLEQLEEASGATFDQGWFGTVDDLAFEAGLDPHDVASMFRTDLHVLRSFGRIEITG